MCGKPDVDAECDWLCEFVAVTISNNLVYVIFDPDTVVFTVFLRDTLSFHFYQCFENCISDIHIWCVHIRNTLSSVFDFYVDIFNWYKQRI